MKPVKLIIEGIGSYYKRQEIDFDKLMEYKIFGIVGNTGSGKSTIIDAIFLALYGKIPRYDTGERYFVNRTNDNRNGYVRLEFIINFSGESKIYAVEKNYKLNINKNDENDIKIEAKNSKLLELVNGEEELVVSGNRSTEKEVERIVGLSYEDFKRAVILPQGQFSSFLYLKNKERLDMLERIFKLEKYGKKLKTNINTSLSEVRNNKSIEVEKKNMLSSFDKEKIDEIKKEIAELEKQQKKNTSELELNNKKNEELNNKLNEYKNYLDEKKTYNILMEESAEYKSFEKNIDKYRAFIELKDIIADIDNNKVEYIKLKEVIEKAKERINVLKKDFDIQIIEKNKIEDFRKNDFNEYIKEISKLENLLIVEKELQIKNKSLNENKEKINNNNKEINALNEQISEVNKNKEQVKNAIKKSEKNIEEVKYSQDYKIELINLIEKEKENKINQDKLNQNKEIIKEKTNIKNKCLEELNILINNKKDIKNQIEELKSEIVSNKYNESIKLISEHIHKGDNCPICNNKIDEINLIKEAEDYKEKEEQLAKVEKELNEIEKNTSDKEKEILRCEQELEYEEKYKSEYEEKIKEYSDLINKFYINNQIDNLANELNRLNELDKQSNLLNEDIKKYNLELKELELISEDNNNKLQSKKIEESKISAIISENTKDISNLKLKLGEEQDIQLTLDTINKEKTAFELKEKEVIGKLEDVTKRLEKGEEFLEEKSLQYKICNNTIEEKEKIVKEKLNNINTDIKELDNYKITKKDFDFKIANLEEFNNKLLISKNNLEKYSENIKTIRAEDKYKELYEEENKNKILISELKDRHDNFISKISELNKDLQQGLESLEKVKEINKLIKEYDEKIILLEKLQNLLKEKSFIEFMATRQLKYIVKDADIKLSEITNGNLSIEMDGIDFIICDKYNGGIRRNVNTLSGGEAFMVSLSLAIALSNKVKLLNNGSLDIFFLDEGFGSLDEKSLDKALDSLFSLSKNNINFGLITHVDNVKNRLPRKLEVIKDVDDGSRARII